MGQSPVGDCPCELLLQFDGRPSLFELALDRVGLFLGDALLDRDGRAVDEVLRFLEAQAGDRTDDLDHLDLLAACLGEHDVEGRLLLVRGGTVAGRRSAGGCDGNRSCGGDAPLLLELVLQLDEVEDGHAPELLDELVCVCLCHYSSCPSGWSAGVSSAGSSSAGASSVGASPAGASSAAALGSGVSASAAGSAAASASGSGTVSPCSCSWLIRASMTPTRSRSGAVNKPTIVVSGAATAPASWARTTSAGGKVANRLISTSETVSPSSKPPRITSTSCARAVSFKTFAAAAGSPSALMKAMAVGPSISSSSFWTPACSAASFVSVFLTTEKRAPVSKSLERSSSISGIVRPR